MKIDKIRITEPIARSLLIALNNKDYCIDDYELHPRTLSFLVKNNLLMKSKYNFADFEPINFTLTIKGKQIARKILDS